MTNKFESLLELLINEENEKAEALFHEIVVEKSRDIYEGLADEDTKADAKEETKEAKDEAKEDNKEEVKETETTEAKDEKAEEKVEETAKEEAKDEEVKETAKEEPKDEAKAEESIVTAPAVAKPVEKTEEEKIEEIGGDATDELIKDISADDEGEGDKAADDMEVAMDPDAENGEEAQSQEERIVDLEDALDELKAEFEAMMGDKGDDNGEEEAEEQAIAPVVPTATTQPIVNAESKEAAKETVKEYKIQKSADNSDKADSKASPVKATTSKHGGTPVTSGVGGEDKGRPAPTAKAERSGGFENTGGKEKGTSMKKEAPKADTKDHSDKSAKSPVASRK